MNAGSFFFAEMRRITSSESPGATLSVSTSVTKPCVYSRLISSSMWAVLGSMASAAEADRDAHGRGEGAHHLVERDLFERGADDPVDPLPVGAHLAGWLLLAKAGVRAAVGHAKRPLHGVEDWSD